MEAVGTGSGFRLLVFADSEVQPRAVGVQVGGEDGMAAAGGVCLAAGARSGGGESEGLGAEEEGSTDGVVARTVESTDNPDAVRELLLPRESPAVVPGPERPPGSSKSPTGPGPPW